MLQAGALGAAMAVAAFGQGAQNGPVAAKAALLAGEADHALALIASLPASAETHSLACRVQLTLQHWDTAVDECEQAVRMDNDDSDYHLWLGRALGEKAQRASFFSAYSLAKRTRAEFETAARLDPRNAEALADLGEFYSTAPGIVGGGEDKAQSVALELDRVDAARAHELRARIAEGNKDYTAAERELKASITASQHPAFQWMSLASFYLHRSRWTDMESAIQSGLKAAQHDRHAGVALYDGASLLLRAKRNPELAVKMMQEYLDSSSKTDEAPAFEALTRMAQLKAQLGDKEGAQRARAAALSLAHDYKPALDLKF